MIRRRIWTEAENNFLLEKAGTMSRQQLARALDRTVHAISMHLYELKGKCPPPQHVNGAVTEEVAVPAHSHTAAEDDKSLLLWFVAQAWEEGHEILIPTLGATFKKSFRQQTQAHA